MTLDVLTKLESGRRRIDIDDLIALAVALDVSPTRLYLTEEATNSDFIDLLPNRAAASKAAWRWAHGEWPLEENPAEPHKSWHILRFFDENQPEHSGALNAEDAERHEALFRPIIDAARTAIESGRVNLDDIIARLRIARM